jgi:aspartokinase
MVRSIAPATASPERAGAARSEREPLPSKYLISEGMLATVPRRTASRDVIVLKFGGTTIGATPEEGRIKLARITLADVIEQGSWAVPVFSAYRRGRGGSADKVSVTDLLQHYEKAIFRAPDFATGIAQFERTLLDVHLGLIRDLKLDGEEDLVREIESDVAHITNTVTLCCTAHETIPSLDDYVVTAGERLAVKILAGYFNRMHAAGKFPWRAAPVTALELGIYTDDNFGSAAIDWPRAVEHASEVVIGQYLEHEVMPVVSGFDGIYDPGKEFKEIMQTPVGQADDRQYTNVYRTSLGRGGSDLTATFLGLALGARYVGFCKETPGVLTADDMLVGDDAQTIPTLSYDLATEAGNIYSRAVEPVRAGGVPVHIFDPAVPRRRTVISDARLDDGLYIVERPLETVNVHVGTIPDEPGELSAFLGVFGSLDINVEEIRHQRAGSEAIVIGDAEAVQAAMTRLDDLGLRPVAAYTWYIRVIGNVTMDLAAGFNAFMQRYNPLSLTGHHAGGKVVTATIARNRAGRQLDEITRVEAIVRELHEALVVAPLRERRQKAAAAR